jgi:hypothetical protein
VSKLPTISNVEALTVDKYLSARSVLPPRDTTAFIIWGLFDAAINAAAAPVLEPKYPILSCLVSLFF